MNNQNNFTQLETRLAGNFSALIAQNQLQYSRLQIENEDLMKQLKEKDQKIKELEYKLGERKEDSNGGHRQPNTSNK